MIRNIATRSACFTRVASLPMATLLLFGAVGCSSDDTTEMSDGSADAAGERAPSRDATSEPAIDGNRPDASVAPDVAAADGALRDVVRVEEAAPDGGSVQPPVDAAIEPSVEAATDPNTLPEAGSDDNDDASDGALVDAGPDAEVSGPPRLVGYWKFDELTGTVAADSSGNANDGTLTTGATFAAGGAPAVQSPNLGSLQIDGAGGTAVLGANGLPAVDAPKTISMWVNYTAITAVNQTILALTNSAFACGVQVGIRNGNVAISSWGGGGLVNSAGAPPAGGWHNVIYTFDGTTHRLYIDGAAPVTSVAVPQSCAVTQNVVGTWATHAPPYDEFYGGGMDELRIYSGVLSTPQIAALAVGADPSLVPADAGLDSAGEAAPVLDAAIVESGVVDSSVGDSSDSGVSDSATADRDGG
jgi:hypothetical protein